ncbi:hypothetical protein [Acinetobacter qingfengensis]|uniref:hypothetical protein n=1 Tax=Acinetobacter qingfengensis TaxID=1262585 RepID=UPI000AB0C312|nr:hypothetical protein [Acinetobacter qingfengensis]
MTIDYFEVAAQIRKEAHDIWIERTLDEALEYAIEQTWQAAKKEDLLLDQDCMINQTWFMKGTPVSNLIKYAEEVYKAEAITQNSKIKFGTDDNEHWFAHDVPFFGKVQLDRIEEYGIVEWDIYFGDCWQGPFHSKARCIQHLEECIQEKREEAQEENQ